MFFKKWWNKKYLPWSWWADRGHNWLFSKFRQIFFRFMNRFFHNCSWFLSMEFWEHLCFGFVWLFWSSYKKYLNFNVDQDWGYLKTYNREWRKNVPFEDPSCGATLSPSLNRWSTDSSIAVLFLRNFSDCEELVLGICPPDDKWKLAKLFDISTMLGLLPFSADLPLDWWWGWPAAEIYRN